MDQFFNTYKDPQSDVIGPAQLEKFCGDMGIDSSDVSILVLAWHLKSQQLGHFSREEFHQGMKKLRVANIASLKVMLENVKKNYDKIQADKFYDLYQFSFRYCLERPTQKFLSPEIASIMLNLVLMDKPHVKTFTQFLVDCQKKINIDQWKVFLDFSKTIQQDFSNYNEEESWPCIFDEYVEYQTAKQLLPESQ
uniref:Defective in cullin neddylation protein n=1 Tax=Arcella intermedia TaxID=1963864 RepID=A0A6B2LJG9_9EUKA